MWCFHPFNYSSLVTAVSLHKQAGRGGKGQKQQNWRKKGKGPSEVRVPLSSSFSIVIQQQFGWKPGYHYRPCSQIQLSALTLYEHNLKEWIHLLLVLSIEDKLGSTDTICVPTAILPVKEIYWKIVGSSLTQTTWTTRKLTTIHYENFNQESVSDL